jgi:hypothetical protein
MNCIDTIKRDHDELMDMALNLFLLGVRPDRERREAVERLSHDVRIQNAAAEALVSVLAEDHPRIRQAAMDSLALRRLQLRELDRLSETYAASTGEDVAIGKAWDFHAAQKEAFMHDERVLLPFIDAHLSQGEQRRLLGVYADRKRRAQGRRAA